MSTYKRGGVYWYKFMWQGRMFRESTKQANDKVARQMEAAHRTSLAKGEVGIREKKRVPTLTDFCEKRFESWGESALTRKTWRDFDCVGLRAIKGYAPLANSALDAIGSEEISNFASHRLAQGLQVSTVNSSLRILRRVLRVAVEWGELGAAPKVRMLTGERHRERVLTGEEEARYLLSAGKLLADVATVLVDTGLRPEECYRLKWEFIAWDNGRNGTLLNTHGKTKAARRMLPMTPRVRSLLEARWQSAGRPLDGWIWPAATKSEHAEPSTVKKLHARAIKMSGVRPFVLYTLRHTFLTRLGESGCDVWTLARIAGHSSIAMSLRYVHPSENAVLTAMSRLGTNLGTSGN